MANPLVSIITPCYNGEKTAHRMIESILNQTYSPIEFIFINDGSKDKTEELFNSYLPKFQEKGIKTIYRYQENAGQATAVNLGLKLFTGDYLCWTDSDDLLHPDSVRKRVEFLEEHPEYDSVQSDAYIVNDTDLDTPIKRISENFPKSHEADQFELCLRGESFICCHCFMVRTEVFLEVNPTRSIYTGKREQNWQLLLPVYYKRKRYFLNEPLCSYVISPNSHSHAKKTTVQLIERTNGYIEILTNTLNNITMGEEERKKYISIILNIYARKKLFLSVNIKDKELAKKELQVLKSIGRATFKDKFACAAASSKIIRVFFRFAKKIF